LASVDPDLVLYGVDSYNKVVRWRLSAGGHDSDPDHPFSAAPGTGAFPQSAFYRSDGLHGGAAPRVRSVSAWRWAPDRGNVLRMVLRGAFFPRWASAWRSAFPPRSAPAKLMTQQLFSVRPWDPVHGWPRPTLAFSGSPPCLASALPAWRAAGSRNPWSRCATNEEWDDLFWILLRKIDPFFRVRPAGWVVSLPLPANPRDAKSEDGARVPLTQ